MTTTQEAPDGRARMPRNAFLLLVILIIAAEAVLVLLLVALDDRLESVESHLEHKPPPRYKLPDFDAHSVTDVSPESLDKGQLVYVPVYSHVYHDGGRPFLLETTLSIRNTDPDQPVYVRSVRYYDTDGKLSRTYVNELLQLAPLGTIEFLVERRDTVGGSGANFIVEWLAADGAEEPLIETVMVGTSHYQTICFSRAGRTLSRTSNVLSGR